MRTVISLIIELLKGACNHNNGIFSLVEIHVACYFHVSNNMLFSSVKTQISLLFILSVVNTTPRIVLVS